MNIGEPRIVDNSNSPERKVIKVKPVRRGSLADKLGTKHYLWLECGHMVGCKVAPPETAKCLKCENNEPVDRGTTLCPCCGHALHFHQFQGMRLVTEENGQRVYTARCPSTHKYFKVQA